MNKSTFLFFLFLVLGISNSPAKECDEATLEISGKVSTPFHEVYAKAVRFSDDAHAGEIWLHGKPYSAHYNQVEDVLREHGFSEALGEKYWALMTVSRLHDVVEKTNKSIDEIRAVFGDRIATGVDGTTPIEPKDPSSAAQVKKAKEAYYEKTKKSPEAMVVKVADRIANFVSYLRDGIVPRRYLGDEHTSFENALRGPPDAEPLWRTLDYLVTHAEELAKTKNIPAFSEMSRPRP